MNRTLYLHIGSHKTGTTSIQKYLAANVALLADRGVHYPVGSNGLKIGIVGGIDLTGDEDEGPKAGKKRAQSVVDNILSSDAPVVIGSTESFSYLFEAPQIQIYHDLLDRHFSTIKIISYLRRQDQFAISHHQEGANPQVKPAAKLYGHSPTALPQPNDIQRKYLDYDTRIGHWANVFGNDAMVVRAYDRFLLKNGDSVADFLDIVGLGDLDVSTAEEKNVSMGFVRTKVGHILHETVRFEPLRVRLMKLLPNEGRLLPRRDAARAFVAPYVAGNRRLNARFKITALRDLFSDDFSMFPEGGDESWTETTANATIRAIAEMLNVLASLDHGLTPDQLMAAAMALSDTNVNLALKFKAAAEQSQLDAEGVATASRKAGRRTSAKATSKRAKGQNRKVRKPSKSDATEEDAPPPAAADGQR